MRCARWIIVLCLLSVVCGMQADEGMWMLGSLNKHTRQSMQQLGLKLPASKLYHPTKSSLKDAVVSFGGFCSGVVVSDDGLVFTNHHCGFNSIQQHSGVQHDYLKNGFVARTRSEELPNPELYVRFLLKQEDVTRRVLGAVREDMDEAQRSSAIDSMRMIISDEVSAADSTLVGVVDTYYAGNEFWLSVYRDFNDVRLVYAPPSSIGKFGWDTDNWMWPRHTGDFSVFRIYADKDNHPADYSPHNVPYRPSYVAPISLDGYREGSFCMTLGYPGTTNRYLSSFGIEEHLNSTNRAQIEMRQAKLDVWKAAMRQSDRLRINYAAKYDACSNYWKNSIGVETAMRKLRVVEKKRQMEEELRRWIRYQAEVGAPDGKWLHLFTDLELGYKERSANQYVQSFLLETFFEGPELLQLALRILNFDFGDEPQRVEAALKEVVKQYADMDAAVDKEVFVAMAHRLRQHLGSDNLPAFYCTVDTLYGGNLRAYADTLYARSEVTTVRGLKRFLEQDSTFHFFDDPAVSLTIDLLTQVFELNMQMQASSVRIEQGERRLNALIRRMYGERHFYPDANSTLRLSFGTVCGYRPQDAVYYNYYTTTEGVLAKVKEHAGDSDFAVQPQLLDLLQSRDFGTYANAKGELPVCFLTNNDITGGNSGSAMFNDRGELIGLAFDGNWEGISSDYRYEPALQRTIGVDVRYMLYVMEQYGNAGHLLRELKMSGDSH